MLGLAHIMASLEQKYNPLEREEKWREFWEKEGIYNFNPSSKGKVFSVDTPPPYLSAAHLHAGHAMSYTQAEFVVRYKRMRGFNIFYPMGFDDNGLPTERFVEKKYNVDKAKITRSEFIKLCLDETALGSKVYKDFFSRLGISVDWSLLYSTIDERSQSVAQRSFIDLYKKNLIDYRKEPVIWCPFCRTALSQADLDDAEQDTFLNYIDFEFEDGVTAPIATTRPELIPACVALYTNSKDPRYAKYIGKKARVALSDRLVPVLADDEVLPEFGTGLMMVCTWGDSEDVERWKRDSLETIELIGQNGKLTEAGGKYAGLNIVDARAAVLADLESAGKLVKKDPIKNVLNVHERCGKPFEFVLAPQWFIKVIDNKEVWNKRGAELNWNPPHMKQIYDSWVNGLKWDWCISRQRFYGVPFPLWHCGACGEIILANEKSLPIDPRETKAPVSECPKCKSTEITPETDVMDTWMTSSLTPMINSYWGIEGRDEMKNRFPMSVRVQAFEIIRTWLFYSIVKAEYHTQSIPWKDVMISGWGLDQQGRKISKSLGNFVDPDTIIKKYSADALRFWSAGATLGQNLRYNEDEIKVGQRTITKLWNASKFIIGNLEGFDPKTKIENLEASDRWVLSELQQTISRYIIAFDKYDYASAKEVLNQFFWNRLCDNYLEMVKYRIYALEDTTRSAAQSTLYNCLFKIIKLYAPLMPFITEEIYQGYFKQFNQEISIHVSQIPDAVELSVADLELTGEFEDILSIVTAIRGYKSQNSLALNSDTIKKLLIRSDSEQKKEIKSHFQLLSSLLHIEKIVFGEEERGDDKPKEIIQLNNGLILEIFV